MVYHPEDMPNTQHLSLGQVVDHFVVSQGFSESIPTHIYQAIMNARVVYGEASGWDRFCDEMMLQGMSAHVAWFIWTHKNLPLCPFWYKSADYFPL